MDFGCWLGSLLCGRTPKVWVLQSELAQVVDYIPRVWENGALKINLKLRCS